MEDWQQLGPEQASAFIQAVASVDEPALFDVSVCSVHMLLLSFYEGYALYRIINKHMLPYLVLDYLSNGEDHYYMDGSEQAFHNLNARRALSLTQDNVIDYLDLYISYVYERGNSLGFGRNLNKEDNKGSAYLDESTQIYQIKAPLIFHDKTVEGDIHIDQKGGITLRSPVKTSFLLELEPVQDIPYRHPFEAQIIEQSISILSGAETGRELLKLKNEHSAEIRVLSSPNYHGFITKDRLIYILMPAAEQSGKFFQALVLAYSLQDIKQLAAGYGRPHPAQEDIYGTVNFGKNLDMVLETCKIVEEFEGQDAPGALYALKRMGLESVYKGYKNKLSDDVLMDVYIKAMEADGVIAKE